MDKFKFELLTRRPGLKLVLDSVDRAFEVGFKHVKLNAVVIQNINDDELSNFVALTRNKAIYVRFIEYMPFDGNKWNEKKFLSYSSMLDMIRQEYPNIKKVQDEGVSDTSKVMKLFACF